MIKIKINNIEVEVEKGKTILEAAQKIGVKIPTLCWLKEFDPFASCFVCVVEVKGKPNLFPACASQCVDGMDIVTDSNKVKNARKAALELLLSDHTGDCEAPCTLTCPALIDIPGFIKAIKTKNNDEAIKIIKQKVALPAVLGRVCPEICERGCRRKDIDKPVAICHLKRHAADADLSKPKQYMPEIPAKTGKKTAIIGSGPAGLTAAYYLLSKGHDCVMYEEKPRSGGMLRYGIPDDRLSKEVLDKEIEIIIKMGLKIEFGKKLGRDIKINDLTKSFDAVILAVGSGKEALEAAKGEGLLVTEKGITADTKTYYTGKNGIFACGDCVTKTNLTVRSSYAGRITASSVDQYLLNREVTGEKRPFSVKMGKLEKAELDIFLETVSKEGRVLKDEIEKGGFNKGEAIKGFTAEEAVKEAERCLVCSCIKLNDCGLRDYSIEYGADPNIYKGKKRGFARNSANEYIVYESGKCIMCGICIKIAEANKEKFGFSYIGRGFDVRVGIPLNESLKDTLKETALECAKKCPTGAIGKR